MKKIELHDNYEEVFDMAAGGESLIVSRPSKASVVVLSESEYTALDKARRNAEYLEKLDSSMESLARGEGISFEFDELRAFEDMPPEEMKAYITRRKAERVTTS
jgi:antitoxin YefM